MLQEQRAVTFKELKDLASSDEGLKIRSLSINVIDNGGVESEELLNSLHAIFRQVGAQGTVTIQAPDGSKNTLDIQDYLNTLDNEQPA